MVVNTRSTPRDPPAPSSNTNLKDGPTQLLPPWRPAVRDRYFHSPIVFAFYALCSFFSGTFLNANSLRCSIRLSTYLFHIHQLTFHPERGGVIVSTMYISHVRTHVVHNHKYFIPVLCFWIFDCFNSWHTRCSSITLTFHRFKTLTETPIPIRLLLAISAILDWLSCQLEDLRLLLSCRTNHRYFVTSRRATGIKVLFSFTHFALSKDAFSILYHQGLDRSAQLLHPEKIRT